MLALLSIASRNCQPPKPKKGNKMTIEEVLKEYMRNLISEFKTEGCTTTAITTIHLMQAKSQLLDIFKEMVEEDKPRSQYKQLSGRMFGKVGLLTQDIQNAGYNQAKQEIRERIEKEAGR